ncbi:hypothetical protein [Psychroflexus planctonicus]|uniref:DUF4249 domain-containing protein n=1 Tax=Psychroflexus planctonicus TaxID=1526575 RepID=A0ABQ1SDZ2_9FLAO|nr:hypothetical protein [Psychroflexus planctonicus]GGE24592.1 hypothetical protein GCM10010832_01630 [Psychroflexus planctonicus]
MKKTLVVVLVCLVCSSCTKLYNLKERLTLDVSVIDESNTELANVNIDVFADNYRSLFLPDVVQGINPKFQPPDYNNDLISFGETDLDGNARLHFPRDGGGSKDNDYQVILSKDEEGRKPLRIFLKIDDFQDFYVQIPPQKLYLQADLTPFLVSSNLSADYSLVEYELIGEVAHDFITVDEFSAPKKYTQVQEIIDVQKNQTLQLNYTLLENIPGNSNEITYQVFIEIGEELTEYAIENP